MTPRTIRLDYPADPATVDILRAFAEEAAAEGIDHMLVGATARDILLTHVFGIETRRATYDMDFAIAVKDWQQFDAMKNRLIARSAFKASDKAQQRLYYQGERSELNYPIDLVPFGGIAHHSNEIAWPPDMKVIMNVAGYDDVLAAAELVAFAPDFEGKVVSLAGLAILRIVAWSDRGRDNPKDAHDLLQLLDNYAVAGNFDRVYDEEGVLDAGNYDPDLAGAYLLGKDVERVASAQTLNELTLIIARDFDRLALEMVKSIRHMDNAEQRVMSRLRLLQQGILTSSK